LFSLDNFKFKQGYLIRDANSKEEKSDPKHVTWEINITDSDGRKETERKLGIHKCTKADYEAFYPTTKKFKKVIDFHKKGNDFWCMDE
jgi:hypothetical protein